MKKLVSLSVFLAIMISLTACSSSKTTPVAPATEAPVAVHATEETAPNIEIVETTEAQVSEILYFEEASALPTPDSVTKLDRSGSGSGSSNGIVTSIYYSYTSFKNQDKTSEMFDEYLAYLRNNGFTLEENGPDTAVYLDGVKLVTININGTTMKLNIDPNAVNKQNTESFESTAVSLGETIKLDFAEITLNEIRYADAIVEKAGGVTYKKSTANSGNQMFWLETTMKNVGTSAFGFFGFDKFVAKIIFDDTYVYDAQFEKLSGGMDISPFESAKVYICADVPTEMLNKYTTVKIQFAFNDYFNPGEKEFGQTLDINSLKYRFELEA